MPIPAIIITIAKAVGTEAAMVAAKKYILPQAEKTVSKISDKLGEDATLAGINHLKQNTGLLITNGLQLTDKRARMDAVGNLSKIGLGTVEAALSAKSRTSKEVANGETNASVHQEPATRKGFTR